MRVDLIDAVSQWIGPQTRERPMPPEFGRWRNVHHSEPAGIIVDDCNAVAQPEDNVVVLIQNVAIA